MVAETYRREPVMKSEGDNLTPEEMREWLRQELADLTKAMELRVQDATDFVTGYALGKLSPEQAMKRLSTYEYRWGDSPIQGVITDPAMTNEAILRQLAARG